MGASLDHPDSAIADRIMIQLPILSLTDEPAELAQKLGDSFSTYGFAMIKDHGLDPALVAPGVGADRGVLRAADRGKAPLLRRAGRWPARLHPVRHRDRQGCQGARPQGILACRARDRSRQPDRRTPCRANVWPDRPEGFRETFEPLFAEFDRVGNIILSRIAVYLGLDARLVRACGARGQFDPAAAALSADGRDQGAEGAIRAGAHEDINLITLLLGAEEGGLEVLARDGSWIDMRPPEGALVVNVGDMLQRLTNHVLPSTTHRVRNPAGDRARFSRYSMPFFLHLRSDFPIATLEGCISDEQPNRLSRADSGGRLPAPAAGRNRAGQGLTGRLPLRAIRSA